MYHVDTDGNIFEYVYAELSVMEDGLTFSNRMSEYRTQILNVKVVDYIDKEIENYQNFDVSTNQDGSIMAWLIPNSENEDYYDLYIGGNDGAKANVSCQNMFANLENCLTIDLEHFYTEDTTNFGYMFLGCKKMLSINLENWDTSKATMMGSLFADCNNLEQIDISNFNTSNVDDMAAMFYNCKELKTIDLSNFDTGNVKSMNQMFRQCYKLESLDFTGFDTRSLIRTDFMFSASCKIRTIYVSEKWTNKKVTNSDRMFLGCSNLVGAISYDSSKVDINYANYENGYFTYKELSI